MKTLYKVDVSGCVYVYADSILEAEDLAQDGVRDNEYSNLEYFVSIPDAKDIKHDHWHDCIPYGEEEDRTCEEILNRGQDENAI